MDPVPNVGKVFGHNEFGGGTNSCYKGVVRQTICLPSAHSSQPSVITARSQEGL